MKAFVFLFPLFAIACAEVQVQSEDPKATSVVSIKKIVPPPKEFDLSISFNELSDNEFELDAFLELDSGAYVVSPFSVDTFYLHFDFLLPKSEQLEFSEDLIESPSSIEQFDPILERSVKFVRGDTHYKKVFKVLSQNDFAFEGSIEFLVEPSCIPYITTFSIEQREGKIQLTEVNTQILGSYKL